VRFHSLATRALIALFAVALPALLVAGLLASTLIATMSNVEADIEKALSAARRITDIRVMIEKEYGLVARLPGELELTKIDRYAAQIAEIDKLVDETLTELATNRRIVEPETVTQIRDLRRTIRAATKEIVTVAKGFSQSTALELVNGPFQANTAVVVTLLDGINSNVETVTEAAKYHLRAGSAWAWKALPVGLAVVFVALAIGYWTMRKVVVKPLGGIVKGMRKLAQGEFDVVLPGLGRRDEIGEMALAVETFKAKAFDRANAEATQKQADVERIAVAQRSGMQALADRFEATVGTIVGAVSNASGQLEVAAATLTSTAESTQRLTGVVASCSTLASVNVSSVATAAEEFSCSVEEVGRQVTQSSRIADEAVQQARQTDHRMTQLSEAANRIGDVVKLIAAIAEQTNLLALNATIEAARAGDAGRGFAVVAQEVKALAGQTAKATSEIGMQIGAIQIATQESVAAIKEIGGTITRISEIAAMIAAAVEEQATTTSDIARNVTQAAEGTTQVAATIEEVNHGAAQTGSASAQVLASAKSLSQESAHLKLAVDEFLSSVRAA
jgi:methyl-accepting chemotaxis protein